MRLFRELKHAGLVAGCCLLLHVTAGSCLAAGDSPWMVRVRALGIMPDDSSSQISVIGGEAEVDSAIAPDLNFTYFFTDNIAAELTLTYAEHDVSAEKTAVGNVDLGSLDLLHPGTVRADAEHGARRLDRQSRQSRWPSPHDGCGQCVGTHCRGVVPDRFGWGRHHVRAKAPRPLR